MGVTETPIPPAVADFLRDPNFAVIGTVDGRGRPHTAATWYLFDDGRILVNMDESRVRLGHMRRDPHVALTVIGRDDPYRQVTLIGRVVDVRDDSALEDIDRLSLRYLEKPYANRDRRSVSAWIAPERWYGWTGGRPWAGE